MHGAGCALMGGELAKVVGARFGDVLRSGIERLEGNCRLSRRGLGGAILGRGVAG